MLADSWVSLQELGRKSLTICCDSQVKLVGSSVEVIWKAGGIVDQISVQVVLKSQPNYYEILPEYLDKTWVKYWQNPDDSL